VRVAITPQYGPADVLEITQAPDPIVGAHEVLVQVHASPVTAGDRRVRAADFPGASAAVGRLMMGVLRPRNPIQGTMFAGEVVAVGSKVSRYAVGDRVFGSADHGAYAELLLRPEDSTMGIIPEGFDYAQAAAVPYGALTAMYFLEELAQLQPGESVLLLGAAGGVGRYAIQVAKHLGARVTAVCSPDDFELVRELGADAVLDYKQDFRTQGQRFDVIFDIADVATFSDSKDVLTPTGRYLTLYISLAVLAQVAWTSMGSGPSAKFGIALGDREGLERMQGWMAQGVIRPVLAQSYPLLEIGAAHALAEQGPKGEVMVLPLAS
jgi:NADPH:quinone reductase-like Zn-dependent oxidoreductase